MNNIEYYKDKLLKSQGKLDHLLQQQKIEKERGESLVIYKKDLGIAQAFLQSVAAETQSQLKIHIEDIVQLALDSVFPGEYKFELIYEIKRGKTEANLQFSKNGEVINDIFNDDSGGLVNMAALGLMIAAWSLGTTRNTIFLDEPMKQLSEDLKPYGAEVLKQLSQELDLQFIIVSHDKEIIDIADKVFEMETYKEDGWEISRIKGEK
jgi:ABC-type glutathione transport system ATPase component